MSGIIAIPAAILRMLEFPHVQATVHHRISRYALPWLAGVLIETDGTNNNVRPMQPFGDQMRTAMEQKVVQLLGRGFKG